MAQAPVPSRRAKKPILEPTDDPGEIVSVAVEYLDQLRSKARHLRYFSDWCAQRSLGRPEEVTFPLLERYQRWLFHYRTPAGKPLAMHTQRSYVATLRPFFKWLVARRHLLANPASELVIPRRIKHLPRDILTAEEAEAVLRQADLTTDMGLRDRAILETFYSTGMCLPPPDRPRPGAWSFRACARRRCASPCSGSSPGAPEHLPPPKAAPLASPPTQRRAAW